MLPRENYFILLFCFTFINSISSQTILTDVNKLLAAQKVITQKKDATSDSTLINAATDLLVVLNIYLDPINQEKDIFKDWGYLKTAYFDNPLLNKLTKNKQINLPYSIWNRANTMAKQNLSIRKKEPRALALGLLNASSAISPSDYLSVRATLDNYKTTANPRAPALRIQNVAIDETVSNKNLVTAKIPFVEELFEVILKRASREVVVSYLEKIVNKDVPNLALLFPKVASEFKDVEISYSNSFIERLRQTFYEDLKTLSLRLPELMLTEEYFMPLQTDPIAYNFLALYTLINLSQNEVPLEESLPITHRFLYEGYTESDKALNFSLAENAYMAEEYTDLTASVTTFKTDLKKVVSFIGNLEDAASDKIDAAEDNDFDTNNAPFVEDYLTDFDNLKNLLNGRDNTYDLFLLPSLLSGKYDKTITGNNTLELYDKYFGEEYTPTQKRAAGLALVRKLNGTWYQSQNLADFIENWANHVIDYDRAVNAWLLDLNRADSLSNAISAITSKRETLKTQISIEKDYWQDLVNLEEDEQFAFDLLINAASNFDIIDFNSKENELGKLNLKEGQLKEIEKRVLSLSKRLSEKYKKFGLTKFNEFIQNRTVNSAYGLLKMDISNLRNSLFLINKQLTELDKKYAPNLVKKKANTIPILQSTEIFTKLLFNLQSNQNKWLESNQLTALFRNQEKKELFNGLFQQSLGSVNNTNLMSSEVLGQLVQQTLIELENLQKTNRLGFGKRDSLKFYRKASFAVNTLNRIMELPMMADKNNFAKFVPLKDQYESLSDVPELSRKTLDFIYFLNIQDHSRAVSSLLRIFSSLNLKSNQITGETDKKIEKRTDAITFLNRHGNFIANLIDARNSAQIEDALNGINGGVASPRIKRKRPLAVSINAYVGVTAGWESWSGDQLQEADEFFNFAPTMPIGLSIGGKVSKDKNRSLSAFISFIDLGSLFAYRADANAVGESEFNFKNMIKPGVQLHYNFPNSPFYFGGGLQYGPQQRRVANQGVTLNSIRYFLGFGVDVPLIGLYQKYEEDK